MNDRAQFARMDQSTKDDWALIVPEAMKMARALPDRVLAHLQLLDGDYGGFPWTGSRTACKPQPLP